MRWATVVLLALVLVPGAAAAWLARGPGDRLPPNVRIGGVDVGGLGETEARRRIEEAVGERLAQPIVLRFEGGSLATSGIELGATAGVDDAIAVARDSRGHWSMLKARLGLGEFVTVPLAYTIDPGRTEAVLDELEIAASTPSVPAGVMLVDGRPTVQPAETGSEPDLDAVAAALPELPSTIDVPLADVPPTVTTDAAERAASDASLLLDNPPAVIGDELRVSIPSLLLRSALDFVEHDGAIDVRLDPDTLAPALAPLTRAERAPKNARFRVVGKRVRVVPGKPGTSLDVAETAAALVAAAGRPEVEAVFGERDPELTTEEARAMRIRSLVSEFTTPYPCCAPRVTNIQRAAEILDGTIIPAGGRFSLNEAMGERTTERGFVLAPMISAGKLVDAIGGGVSQVATTFYNVAFFAGLELIAHTPHEFYISRYPMGREATVSWGGPEMIFRNDWPAAILVKVEAGDTSITVRFYSAKLGRRVETETGAPYAYQAATTIRVLNPALAPGTEQTVQSGGISGFSVDYTRKVYRGDELLRDEKFHVRYRPENSIVEYGPKQQKPPKGAGTGQPGAADGGATGAPGGGGADQPPPTDGGATDGTPPAPPSD